MLSFQEFFAVCAGTWTTERTYHYLEQGEVERSYTEFKVDALTETEKQRILIPSDESATGHFQVDTAKVTQPDTCPGFEIAFNTVSEKGEEVAMSLKALFVPDAYMIQKVTPEALLPLAAQVSTDTNGDIIQGFYLRDQGYSEAGTIAGRFTYQTTRQTLEMTTHYQRSVAVDQMRLLSPTTRLRTIVTYQRPQPGEVPSVMTLIGFGVEHKQ
ncbi:phycobiliprotein lyase [Phormidesmis sp. 146-33]